MARATTQPKRRPMKVRTGDQVKVITGKDRGKTGRVLRVDPKRERVYIEGMNMVKRHTRARAVPDTRGETVGGGVIEREGPIHVSNVMLVDPKDGKPTRVGIVREDGKRQRVSKKTGTRFE
jgi:large subunit ribosomal protein L24